MTKPGLILHIGVSKTGSTAIQRFFSGFPEQVSSRIYYPSDEDLPGSYRGNHLPICLLPGPPHVENVLRRWEKVTGIESQHAPEVIEKQVRQIAEKCNRKGCDFVVLSNEHLSERFRFCDIEYLTSRFSGIFGRMVLIVSLREQYRAFVALYTTTVRNGNGLRFRPWLERQIGNKAFDYKDLLARWASVGWEIVPLVYPENGGDVRSEFCHSLATVVDDLFIPQLFGARENISPGAPYVLMRRNLNRVISNGRLLRVCDRWTHRFIGLIDGGRRIYEGAEYLREREGIQNMFARGNQDVARKFFQRDILFDVAEN